MTQGGREIDIYRGKNPLDLPAYSLVECADFLQVPLATMRTWALGRRYRAGQREKFWRPLIAAADPKTPALSFRNTVELHVLAAMRRKHKVEMVAVRRAIEFLSRQFAIPHPLADQQMLTDGTDLFVEQWGKIVNVSRDGQLEMRSLIEVYLARIDRDPAGLPIRLFPFTRTRIEDSPKLIVLDPAHSVRATVYCRDRDSHVHHRRKVSSRRKHRSPSRRLWAKTAQYSRSDPIRVRCNGRMSPSSSSSTVAWKARRSSRLLSAPGLSFGCTESCSSPTPPTPSGCPRSQETNGCS